MQFIPVMIKLNFQHHYSSLQLSHDPSEIIICLFASQETFLLLSMLKTVLLLNSGIVMVKQVVDVSLNKSGTAPAESVLNAFDLMNRELTRQDADGD